MVVDKNFEEIHIAITNKIILSVICGGEGPTEKELTALLIAFPGKITLARLNELLC